MLGDKELRIQLSTSSHPQMRHTDFILFSFLLTAGYKIYSGGVLAPCVLLDVCKDPRVAHGHLGLSDSCQPYPGLMGVRAKP